MTAAITCIVTFAVPFGGTIALTIMSTVFNNRSRINHADPKRGILWGFIALVPIMWLSVVLTAFLGNVWINKEGSHEVVHGAWLWSIVRGQWLEKAKMAGAWDESGLPLVPLSERELFTKLPIYLTSTLHHTPPPSIPFNKPLNYL